MTYIHYMLALQCDDDQNTKAMGHGNTTGKQNSAATYERLTGPAPKSLPNSDPRPPDFCLQTYQTTNMHCCVSSELMSYERDLSTPRWKYVVFVSKTKLESPHFVRYIRTCVCVPKTYFYNRSPFGSIYRSSHRPKTTMNRDHPKAMLRVTFANG